MKYIPSVLFVIYLAGCAVSTDQLHEDAMGCGKKWVVEPNGIIRTPTEQEKEDQCKPFWDAYNKRLVAITKREERRALNQGGSCPTGSTLWCMVYSKHDKRCGCVRRNGPF